MLGERCVRIEKEDWRGKSKGQGKEKKEYGRQIRRSRLTSLGTQVALSVNVVSVVVLWTVIGVRREY